jgi:hypothetical protein
MIPMTKYLKTQTDASLNNWEMALVCYKRYEKDPALPDYALRRTNPEAAGRIPSYERKPFSAVGPEEEGWFKFDRNAAGLYRLLAVVMGVDPDACAGGADSKEALGGFYTVELWPVEPASGFLPLFTALKAVRELGDKLHAMIMELTSTLTDIEALSVGGPGISAIVDDYLNVDAGNHAMRRVKAARIVRLAKYLRTTHDALLGTDAAGLKNLENMTDAAASLKLALLSLP